MPACLLLRREGGVVDRDFSALRHQGLDSEVEIPEGCGADARDVRVVDGAHARRRIRRRRDGRVLEHQAWVGTERFDELSDGGGRRDCEVHSLALANGAAWLNLVAHCAGEDAVSALQKVSVSFITQAFTRILAHHTHKNERAHTYVLVYKYLVHSIMTSCPSLHIGANVGGQFQNLVCASCSHDRVCRGHRRYNMLCNALRKLVGNALYAVLLCTSQSRLIQPLHVLRLITIKLRIITERLHTIPFQLFSPFDTVSRRPRYVCQGTHRKVDLWWENRQNALEAWRNAWNNHVYMASHPLRASINLS